MRKARVVVGAGWGDEGKGMLTDHYAFRDGPGTLVVRHNGGAQAGHTVALENGTRHVFKHFGSGTLAGASTLLSRHFIVNPMAFRTEYEALVALNTRLVVYADRAALVTTPYDMLVNMAVEEARGTARHGSVGYGINETVVRSEHPDFRLTVGDLTDTDRLAERLRAIRKFWLPMRMATLGYPDALDVVRQRADRAELAERWIEDCRQMLAYEMALVEGRDILHGARAVVFEGAQGLLLDQTRGYKFPYLTRSNTGLRNAMEMAAEAGITDLEVTYATRAYLTRHGAGPLPHASDTPIYPGISDPTNVTGPYQGHLRFAPLNLSLLREALIGDLVDAASMGTGVRVEHGVGLTCVDQVPQEAVRWVPDGDDEHAEPVTGTYLDMVRAILASTGARFLLQSSGPTRWHTGYLSSAESGVEV